MTSYSTAVEVDVSDTASSVGFLFSSGLGVSVLLGLLPLHGEVYLSVDHNKSTTTAIIDCKASLSLHRLVVSSLKCRPCHYPSFLEFVLQVALISADVAVIVLGCSLARELFALYN